jgi:hypothetical protein
LPASLLILFLPYLRGRPRGLRCPRFGLGGMSRRAASLRNRPTTTTCDNLKARLKNGRLV